MSQPSENSERANEVSEPFVAGAYVGNGKPKSINSFRKDFIIEINELQRIGINISDKHFQIKLKCFICDTPARSYLKCIKGHNSKHGCERCLVERKPNSRTPMYLDTDCALRSDESFRNFSDTNHHNAASPLLFLQPAVNMIDDFILDSMHLCYLGVMNRLVDA